MTSNIASVMRTLQLCVGLVLCSTVVSAQTKVWVKIDSGTALYLNPYQQQWLPLSAKEEVLAKTFMLTKKGAKAMLFKETEVYALPESAYFFIEDVLPKSRVEIVAALTQIEAEQLPKSTREGRERKLPIGLTYGENPVDTTSSNTAAIPYLNERLNAIQYFLNSGRYDAALLSQKRLLTKFPVLYQDALQAERLFMLYDKLELYGFLNDETRRLLSIKRSTEFDKMVERWNSIAKTKLLNR